MKWAEWTYFPNNWQDDPKLDNLRRQRNAGKITRSEYKAGIELIKQDVLMRMLREGRIDVEDFMHPSPRRNRRNRARHHYWEKRSLSARLYSPTVKRTRFRSGRVLLCSEADFLV